MIIEKFEEQVQAFPAKIAVKAGNRTITYSELNSYANQVASAIMAGDQDRDTTAHNPYQKVSLLFEHGADMIIGVIGALKAGKTYVPLDTAYPLKRLLYMLDNSESYLILTNQANILTAKQLTARARVKIDILKIDNIIDPEASFAEFAAPLKVNPDTPAYILYTSGSTGRPKGVMQTQRNILYYTRNWTQRFSITHSDRMTLFSAFSHDGSVQDMFAALLAGAALYPYNIKTADSTNPIYTLLMKEKITIWHSVPTLYRFFTNTLTEKNVFYDIRWVLLGGEPLIPHDFELFKTHFPNAMLANVYGQTESSVSTICTISPGEIFDAVSLGDPLDETKILLVAEDGDIIETMGAGEIVVASDYITPGYWKDEESTRKVFTHDPELGRLYWTGDLGRLTMDGLIKVMGRKDFQIKIRGFRVETGEIESILLQHQAVKEAVVIAKENENFDNYLCAYLVADQTIPPGELRDYLSRELPDYMIPRYFIPLEKMPLTPNGKIDRFRLPEPEAVIVPGTGYEPPTNETEKKLATVWQEVFAVEKVGINDDFIELGGHSLLVISIISRIYQEFNVELQLRDVFANPTIKQLSQLIESSENPGQPAFSSIPLAETKEYYIATPDQRRMFALDQFAGIGTTYNLTMTKELKGPLDRHRCETAFRKLIQRHESLRTSFRLIGDQLVQVIHDLDSIDFQIPYIVVEGSSQTRTRDIKKIVDQFIQPFDLSKAPLIRVSLVKTGKDKHLLLLDIHHIVSDGMSEIVLTNDFIRLYDGKELPGIKLRYRDYSQWLDRLDRLGKIEDQEEYWLNRFNGELPVLELPLDFPRPPQQQFAGDIVGFIIGKETNQQLNRLAKGTGTTLFMVLLAMYNVLLHKYTGQEDIIVGSIIAGRTHVELENVAGFFAKTLAMRNYPTGSQSFNLFLEQLKNSTLEAFENQSYPFDRLVKKLELTRDRSRNPLFDTAFLLLNMPTEITFPGEENPGENHQITSNLYAHEIPTTMFDLYFQAFATGGELICCFQYSTALFKRKTIELMKERFLTLMENILNNPAVKIRDLDYTTAIEKEMKQVEKVEFDF